MLVIITPDRTTILILIRDFPVPFHVTLVQSCCGIKGAWKPLENLEKSKEQLECPDKTLRSCTCTEENRTLGKAQFLYIKLGLLSTLVFASIVLLRCHMYLSPAHRACVWLVLNSNHQIFKIKKKLKVSILREVSWNCPWGIWDCTHSMRDRFIIDFFSFSFFTHYSYSWYWSQGLQDLLVQLWIYWSKLYQDLWPGTCGSVHHKGLSVHFAGFCVLLW